MKHRSKHVPAALAVILAACMVPAFISGVFAAEQPGDQDAGQNEIEFQHVFKPGHIHEDIDVYDVPEEQAEQAAEEAEKGDSIVNPDAVTIKSSFLPKKLDPRDTEKYPWFQCIQIRDQADTNLCWSFSANTVAQIAYAKELWDEAVEANGGSTSGITPQSVASTSPTHLAYFLYNRKNDPLKNTLGDKNISKTPWLDKGGYCGLTFQHMATWSGLHTERAEDGTLFTYEYDDVEGRTHYTGPDHFPTALAYESDLIEQNAIYYKSLPVSRIGVTSLKRVIQEYGAAVISLEFAAKYFNGEQNFYNPSYNYANDHELVVVGWDDDYSRTNFCTRYGEQPQDDGAWIVMNSWGTDFGDNGYLYVSYESADIISDGILALDMEPADPTALNFQYDGTGCPRNVVMYAGESAANIFTVPEDQPQVQLDEVGFTTYNNGTTNYHIDIYTGLTDLTNPKSGILATSMDVTTETTGYKTFALPEGKQVRLEPGDTYSIVIKYPAETLTGIETDVEDKFTVITHDNQSFYYEKSVGKWCDAAKDTNQFCFRIKGIAHQILSPCTHAFETVATVPAQKGVAGYTEQKCSLCGYECMTDITPAKSPKPAKIKIKSLTGAKKAFTVKWAKDTEKIAGENISKYQVRYSLKSSMSGAKTVSVKGYKSTSKKVSKLKSGKKYYVQIRACYVDHAGKSWASAWSAKKAVKAR